MTPLVPRPHDSHTAAAGARAESSDAELLAAHLAGDRFAFAVLLDRHHRRLFVGVFGVLGRHHDTEDALQEAFTKAARYAGSYRGNAPVSAWLWRIAINTAIGQLAKRQRLATPINLPVHHEPDFTGSVLTSAPPASAELVDDLLSLEAALQALSHRLRSVFVLVVLRDMPPREVAEVLGIPENTVNTRLFRARRQLRATIDRTDHA